MRIEVKEIYKCEYCNKLYQIKRWSVLHELRCKNNPINKRPCFDCKSLTMEEIDYYYDTYMGESSYKIKVFFCPQKKYYLYPPLVEYKKNELDIDDNHPMPKKCDLFKSLYLYEG